MTELELWLRQVASQPDDVHLRGVFGDWLEEQGDGRAEWVRQSRDAEECLLEFPLESDYVDGVGKKRLWVRRTGTFLPEHRFRPVLKLEGFDRFEVGHLGLLPKGAANQHAQVVTKTPTKALCCLSTARYGNELELSSWRGNWFVYPNLYLVVRTDRPCPVEWELQVTVAVSP